MAIPIINPTTSVLGFTANTYAAYQAASTGASVTTWACPNLPPGLSISSSTGLISGAPTLPGVYNCVLSATNSDGTGTLAITFGIDDPGFVADIGIEVNIDLITGAVSFPTSSDGKLHGKNGDYLPLLIALQKNGVSLDLPVTEISIGIKEYEGDSLVELNAGGAFTKVGAYENTRYRILFYLDPTKLSGPLSDYEGDAVIGGAAAPAGTDPSQVVTQLAMPTEIRIQLTQTDTGLTPSLIDRSTQIFPLIVERNVATAP